MANKFMHFNKLMEIFSLINKMVTKVNIETNIPRAEGFETGLLNQVFSLLEIDRNQKYFSNEVVTPIKEETFNKSPLTMELLSKQAALKPAESLPLKETESNTKPMVTVAYLDMLKELKMKFAAKQKKDKPAVSNLNEIADKIYATPTGAYLRYRYPNADLEKSVELAVRTLLQNVKNDQFRKNKIASDTIISALNTDFEAVVKEVTALSRDILIHSVDDEAYHTLYHGHGNSLRLYVDMLREIKSSETIMDLTDSNPLRDKSAVNSVRTVDTVLSQYKDEAQKFADQNHLTLFDEKRTLGVGFAPDKIDFIRDNIISANVNLFGNSNLLAECTLFYFIDSFNISDPNEALVLNLVRRISDPSISEEALKEKAKRYKEVYEKYMSGSGGNLMEIKVKKGKFGENEDSLSIDDIAFPSWMKGLPVWLNKDNDKLATKSTNYNPVAVLDATHPNYTRPLMSEYLNLMARNPEAFIEKYSNFSNNKKVKKNQKITSLDRAQARLVVDPITFNDGENVKIKQYTRFPVAAEKEQQYQQALKKLMREDIQEYLELIKAGKVSPPEGDRLAKLMQFIESGSEVRSKTPVQL